jgi:hypothetical protein
MKAVRSMHPGTRTLLLGLLVGVGLTSGPSIFVAHELPRQGSMNFATRCRS